MATSSQRNHLKLIVFFSICLSGVFFFTRNFLEPVFIVERVYRVGAHGIHPLPLPLPPSLGSLPDHHNHINASPKMPSTNSTVPASFTIHRLESRHISSPVLDSTPYVDEKSGPISSPLKVSSCDLYYGDWVRDSSYPLYHPAACPYVDEAFSCQENGRQDSGYLKWRWKPRGCEIPRFNATDFLERIRGKRMMLVGDSMNRNQFESMLCLLREALPDKNRLYETRGYKITKGRGYYIFRFMDYNCTVEFSRSHFLVREGKQITEKGKSRPLLQIDQIDKTSFRWKCADILIFNTGHWWNHGKTSKGKDYYKEGDFVYPYMEALEAYQRAMKTWAKWIDEHMKSSKKLIFYRGYSSTHFRGDWDAGGTCNNETEPILKGRALDSYPVRMHIMGEVIQKMQTHIFFLNTTRLTNARKDGHPSIYRKFLAQRRKVSTRRQDCSHWCLPGVPDSWNELIYATLVMEASKKQKHN